MTKTWNSQINKYTNNFKVLKKLLIHWVSLEEWLWDWLLVLCKQILTGFLLGISPSGRQGKVWLQYQLDKVLANPGGRCGVRTAHESPHLEETATLHSLALVAQQCRLLWKGCDLEQGSSAYKTDPEGAWGPSADPTPCEWTASPSLKGECWVAHLCDKLGYSIAVGLSKLLAWGNTLFLSIYWFFFFLRIYSYWLPFFPCFTSPLSFTSLINYLHQNPCLRVCFWGNWNQNTSNSPLEWCSLGQVWQFPVL